MKNAPLHIPIKQIDSDCVYCDEPGKYAPTALEPIWTHHQIDHVIDVLWTCKECGKLTAWSPNECRDCDSDYQYDVMRDSEL